MSTIWINIPEGQRDDYKDVIEPEPWTIQAMVNLYTRTAGRFTFYETDTDGVYNIRYVNYTLGYNDTKIKIDEETGGAIMEPEVNKLVVIQ